MSKRKSESPLFAGVECVIDGKIVHCTLAYFGSSGCYGYTRSNYFTDFPYGATVHLHLVRKGANSTHSGYQVELPERLVPFFRERIPHITMSVAPDAKPVDTWKVFATADCSKPCDITVIGTVGYWTSKKGFQTKPLELMW